MKTKLIDIEALTNALPAFVEQFVVNDSTPITPKPSEPVIQDPVVIGKLVGNGYGSLSILKGTGTIKIAPGTYNSITINNPKDCLVDATGVKLIGELSIGSADGISLSGLSVADYSGIPVNFNGLCRKVEFRDISFKNIGNYCMRNNYTGAWDFTDKTVLNDWSITDCVFENTGKAFISRSVFKSGVVTNLLRNFVFSGNTIKNCPWIGSAVEVQAVDGYSLKDNVIDNVNTENNEHNGIFLMTGHGEISGNRLTNHQGNLIRAWGVSFGPSAKMISIHNNTVYNSRKYGAFEWQVTPDLDAFIKANKGKFNYTNAEVYKNTAGKLATSKDWEGQMLDLYNTGGTLSYHGNVGFEMNTGKKMADMINNMSSVNIVANNNNRYYATQKQAVTDTVSFKSLVAGIGAQ